MVAGMESIRTPVSRDSLSASGSSTDVRELSDRELDEWLAELGRERCRVDALLAEIARKASGAAEAAGPDRARKRRRAPRPARKRTRHRRLPFQRAGNRRPLARPAQNEYAETRHRPPRSPGRGGR